VLPFLRRSADNMMQQSTGEPESEKALWSNGRRRDDQFAPPGTVKQSPLLFAVRENDASMALHPRYEPRLRLTVKYTRVQSKPLLSGK